MVPLAIILTAMNVNDEFLLKIILNAICKIYFLYTMV